MVSGGFHGRSFGLYGGVLGYMVEGVDVHGGEGWIT